MHIAVQERVCLRRISSEFTQQTGNFRFRHSLTDHAFFQMQIIAVRNSFLKRICGIFQVYGLIALILDFVFASPAQILQFNFRASAFDLFQTDVQFAVCAFGSP